jgi:hypothetical protein
MKTESTKVFFHYEKINVKTEDGTHTEIGDIEAIAKNIENGEIIASRVVKLRHGDKPNKLVGRRYAFKKLMDYIRTNHMLENTEVGVLWEQFSSECKQPKIQ